jgi:hypothetical protein
VNVDDRAEKAPRARLSVDVQHAEYLQEANAANGRCGEDLAVRADHDDDTRRSNHDNVYLII